VPISFLRKENGLDLKYYMMYNTSIILQAQRGKGCAPETKWLTNSPYKPLTINILLQASAFVPEVTHQIVGIGVYFHKSVLSRDLVSTLQRN
jgi:hypothetical protein